MWKIGVLMGALSLPIMASEARKYIKIRGKDVYPQNEKMESLLYKLTHQRQKAHSSALKIVKQFIDESRKYVACNALMGKEYKAVEENANKKEQERLARRTASELKRESQQLEELKDFYNEVKNRIDKNYKEYLENPSADELHALASPKSSPVRVKRSHTLRRNSQEWVAAIYGIGKRSSSDDESKRATEKVLKAQYDTTFQYRNKFEQNVAFYKEHFFSAYTIAIESFEQQDYSLACEAIQLAFECAKEGVKNLTNLTQETATKNRMDRLVQNQDVTIWVEKDSEGESETNA